MSRDAETPASLLFSTPLAHTSKARWERDEDIDKPEGHTAKARPLSPSSVLHSACTGCCVACEERIEHIQSTQAAVCAALISGCSGSSFEA